MLRATVRRRLLLPALLTMALLPFQAGLGPGQVGGPVAAQAAEGGRRPNIVLITTDDQRVEDLRWMPHTRRLLGGPGIEFTDALSPHPLCCPARAHLLTGQYGQNNGVHHNSGRHGGYGALRQPGNTVATWLSDAGYRTGMVGKFIHGYAGRRIRQEPGWTHWSPMIKRIYAYRGTTFFNDGRPRRHARHVDDVVVDQAQDYIREFARDDRPFFVWASHLAPHLAGTSGWGQRNPRPAPRHKGTLAGERNPSADKPSFGVSEAAVGYSQVDADDTRRVQRKHVARIEALQAVDEGVRDIVKTLRRTRELRRTYIFFASDNGYLMGEHGLVDKNVVYAEALAVPLLVRAPRSVVDSKRSYRRSSVPVTLVDLPATFVDLAGARAGRTLDGTSFAPLLHGRGMRWRDTQLVQTGNRELKTRGWEVRGVRTSRWTYGRNLSTGAEQLYDREADPYEMDNLAADPEHTAVLRELRRRTRVLSRCAGAECATRFGRVPEPVSSD